MKNIDRFFKARKLMTEAKQHEKDFECRQTCAEIVFALSLLIETANNEITKSKKNK